MSHSLDYYKISNFYELGLQVITFINIILEGGWLETRSDFKALTAEIECRKTADVGDRA